MGRPSRFTLELLARVREEVARWERMERAKERRKERRDEKRRAELKLRKRCGARTRLGTPCQSFPVRTQLATRCKLHGGLSTGPKTVAGRAKIAQAQRDRWVVWRQKNAAVSSPPPPSRAG